MPRQQRRNLYMIRAHVPSSIDAESGWRKAPITNFTTHKEGTDHAKRCWKQSWAQPEKQGNRGCELSLAIRNWSRRYEVSRETLAIQLNCCCANAAELIQIIPQLKTRHGTSANKCTGLRVLSFFPNSRGEVALPSPAVSSVDLLRLWIHLPNHTLPWHMDPPILCS